MNLNFSRPRPRTPVQQQSQHQQKKQQQQQSSTSSSPPPASPTRPRPTHIRLTSIAESISAASIGPRPDLAEHPAFKYADSAGDDAILSVPPSPIALKHPTSPTASPVLSAARASPRPTTTTHSPQPLPAWTAPWANAPRSPNLTIASSRFSANTSSASSGSQNGDHRRNNNNNNHGVESPPPEYSPRLLARTRRKRHVPVGTAIGAPTLTKDGAVKEYEDGDDDDFYDADDDAGLIKGLKTRVRGWKLIALIALAVLVAVAVAVGVGLGVRMTTRKSSGQPAASDGSASAPTASDPTQPFPIGKWSLATYLTNVSAACTANAATWTCYPYSTYTASNPSLSAATLDWVITSSSTPASNTTLLISSSPNPFSLSFTNVSLTLHDAGTINERYSFSTPLLKQVWPTVQLTPDNARDTCFYNNSILAASLYTRMKPTLLAVDNSTATGYAPWTGAVLVEQTSAGGAGVPDCYRTVNGAVTGSSISAQAGLVAQAVGKVCSCVYENAGLEGTA